MRRSSFLVAALAAASLAGCSGLDPRADMPPPRAHVASGKLAVGEPKLAYEPTPEGKSKGGLRPTLDAAAIAEHAAQLMRERGSAKQVQVLREGTSPDAASPLLETTVTDAHVRYVGQSGIFPLKVAFVVCFFPIDIPNYFIASDRFALKAIAHWRLLEPGTQRVLAEGDAEGKQEGVFGDLSRGWYFLGFVRAPQCLDDDSWREIADALRPGAEESLAEQIVVSAETALGGGPDKTAAAASAPRRE